MTVLCNQSTCSSGAHTCFKDSATTGRAPMAARYVVSSGVRTGEASAAAADVWRVRGRSVLYTATCTGVGCLGCRAGFELQGRV